MSNVTLERTIKPCLILWPMTYDFIPLKQIHIGPQMPNDV
jgi:hypothetical protein